MAAKRRSPDCFVKRGVLSSVMKNDASKSTNIGSTEAPRETPSDQKVPRRAYELWEQHGHQDGHDQEYWYEAERELMQTGTPSLSAELAADAHRR